MATVAENLRIHWHSDPNRPPMTPHEVNTLSQAIGGLKRGEHRICRRCAKLMPLVVEVAEREAKRHPHGGLWKRGVR